MVYSPKKYRETEGTKVRRLGFALDEATLKQVAFNHGITQSYESMTQAQKAQLRYVAMIEQAKNIGVTGDMSRTIDTAANGVRVLEARLQQLARAIGNMLLPLLSAILPYVTAFVQVVTEAAQALAEMFGFELPKIELGNISSGYDDVATAADDATAATEKFKGSLAGVDQLNIIGSHSDKNGTGTGYSTDLNIELPTYDFLNGVESKTKEIAENMKQWFVEALPWIEAVGAAIAIAFAGVKIGSFLTALKKIPEAFRNLASVIGTKATSGLFGLVGGLAAGAASGILLYNSIKNLIRGTGDLSNNITMLVSGLVVAGGAIAVFIAIGNPIGAIVTAVGALVGAVMAVSKAIDEANEEIANAIFYADNGGVAIDDFAQCYTNLFDTITSRYQDIVDTSNAISANQEEAEKAAEQISNLTGKYQALGEAMTPDDAKKIKENIETIGKAIKENLGYYTQTLVDNLKTSFHELAVRMGLDVDDMVSKWYILESMGNEALAGLKKTADELSVKIISGKATPQEYAEFQETVKKMSTVNTHTAEQESLNRAFGNIFDNSIDFENEDQVKSAIENIENAANTARDTIERARDSQLADLANYKDTLINWGVDIKYDEKFGNGAFNKLFSDQRSLLETGYEKELQKIDNILYSGIGAIWSQADQKVLNAFAFQTPDFWDYYEANANAGLAIFTPEYWNGTYASEQAYKAKEADKYNRIETLKSSGQFKGIYEALKDTDLAKLSESDLSYYQQIGDYIVEGVTNGALKGSEDLNNALVILAESGVDEFKKALGIASPSKVFAELGGYMMEGLAEGITDGEENVLNAIDTAAVKFAANASGSPKVGFAWEGAKEMYSNNVPADNSVSIGDTYITLEVDGEEIASASQRIQGRQVAMSNGR